MIKRLSVLFLFLLVVLSSSVFAFDEIYDNYVYTVDSFELEDSIFYVSYLSPAEDKIIFVKDSGEMYWIKNGSCQETEFYQYCFYGTKLDYYDYGRLMPNSIYWESAIHIVINSKKPSVSISRTFPTEINKDEDALVRLTITNNGELAVSNLVITEPIPSNAVVSMAQADISGNTLTKTYEYIAPGKVVSFIYRLEPLDYDRINFGLAEANYIYEDSSFVAKTTKDHIKINMPYSSTSSLDKSSVDVNGEFTYTYSVTNEDWSDSLYVDFELLTPRAFEILSVTRTLDRANIIRKSFHIKPGETESFAVTMKSFKEKTFTIYENTHYTIHEDELDNHKNFSISVSASDLKSTLTISKTEVIEGESFLVTAQLANPSKTDYLDISGVINITGFGEFNFTVPYIDSGAKIEFFKQLFDVVEVDDPYTVTVSLDGNYSSHDGLPVLLSNSKNLAVKPFIEDLIITKTFSTSNAFLGDIVTVSVKAKNPTNRPLTFRFEDEYEPLAIDSGISSRDIVIESGDELNIYTYKLIVPSITKSGIYTMVTKVYLENSPFKINNYNITIGDPVEITDDVIIEDSDDVDDVVVVEKKSGLKAFIDDIVDFVVNIFK